MSPENKYTTLASWPMAVSRALIAQGIDPKPVLASAGIDINIIEQAPDERVPINKMTRFWQGTQQATACPSFGLKVGEYVHSMNFRALGLLLVTCKTLAQALQKLISYQALISDSVTTRLQHRPQATALTIEPLAGVDISPLAIDAFFSAFVHHCTDMIGQQKLVVEIELMREKPENPAPWQAFFNCPVTFNATENSLWMDRTMLEQLTIMGDAHLAQQNESAVQSYLEQMNASSWSERTSQVIHKTLPNSEPTLAGIASVFNITERTLGRRLKTEGTTFRQLLQNKRQELAQYYLSKTSLSITEITFNLAFTDVSNFCRAFQRWNAMSPSKYRQKTFNLQ
ncbi:MAG: AraC family transcriptional regulator [Psychrobium sp.]|nr:AraC family transcriptional regulator [Psychrobium sp.]